MTKTKNILLIIYRGGKACLAVVLVNILVTLFLILDEIKKDA